MGGKKILEQHVSQDLIKILGHLELLTYAAMILEGEDDGVFRADKGAVPDGVHDVLEHDVSAHGVAMGDDGLEVDLCARRYTKERAK